MIQESASIVEEKRGKTTKQEPGVYQKVYKIKDGTHAYELNTKIFNVNIRILVHCGFNFRSVC